MKTPAGAIAYVRALSKASPDIVHIHTEGAFALVTLLTRLTLGRRARIVRTVHNVFPTSGRQARSRRWQRLVADPLVDAFVGPSADVVANENRMGRGLLEIPNWVDDRFTPASVPGTSATPRVAVIVGNCSRVKNHELALRAVADTDFSVAHLGSELGASKEELDLLDRLSRDDRVTTRGMGDPLEVLRSGTVFLMPSLNEGMPVALAEAMAIGLPAMISDSPGLRWAAGTSRVTVVDSSPEAWAAALRSRAWSDAPGRSAPDFSVARGIDEHLSLYERLLG